MAYNYPNLYTPYYQQHYQPQMPSVNVPAPAQSVSNQNNGLIWVQGEAGAKSYLVAPGNTILLMDSEAQKFYLKSADNSGMPMPLRVFEYNEIVLKEERKDGENTADFVTRDEFEKRLSELAPKPAKKEAKKDE